MDLLRLYDPYQRAMRRERVFRDRSNPFEVYSDAELLKKYRFHREGLRYLIDILDDGLAPKTLRNHAISKELKVFIGLRYLASGAHQSLVGDEMAIKVTQPTVSRCVSEFLDAMMGIVPALIFWPDDSSACKLHFFEQYNIPNVVGCIDGTHVEIISPPEDEEAAFVNRANYHSVNVQAVCDHRSIFINVVANAPGSFHDSRVLRVSIFHNLYQYVNDRL